jgi:hypothetical protein
MTDKKDPIQQAAEEYQRVLQESIDKKKEELIEKRRQEAAEQEAQELSEAEEKLQEIQAKRAIIQRLRELKEAEERGEDIQDISESVEEESQDELVEVRSAMDNYVDAIKTHEKKKPVNEDANLLGGGTGGDVSRAEFQALKTSLASLGGGGLGERDVIDLINIHAPGGSGSVDSGGLDSAQILNLLGISAGDTLVTNNNIYNTLGVDSNATIIQNNGNDSNSIWYILGIDSSDTISTYADSDVIDLLNDSGVQNILPQLDSAYDLGDSDRRWKDLWLSGNTLHLGDVRVSSRGDSGVGVYANGRRLAYADSYENGLDSVNVIRLIDSALDSLGLLGYTTNDHDSDTLVQVDSAYVQQRQIKYLDSAQITNLIDSAYVQARDSDNAFEEYTTADHDSDTLIQVDSAYVQARVTFPVDSVGLDSVQVLALITSTVDSAYVAARDSDLIGSFYTTADHDSDTLVQVDSAYVRARVKTDQDLSTTDIVTFDQVYANLDGAIEFKANNRSGATILKGQPVYIDGVDGNKPTIALADANDPDKMPAFGLLLEDANDNADAIVVTFGSLKDVDTSAFNLGDTLYIGTTPGTLVSTPPAGTNSLIQNIGRVIRSHGSAGSIKVGGAGRSNATPNLSAGQIFYGNDSDRAVPTLATDVFDSDYINSLVDNPFLHELQDVQIDSTTLASDEFLQWNGSVWTHRPLTIETSLTFQGSIDVTADSAPTGASGSLYVNTGTGVALGSYTGVAGDSFQSGQTIAWSDSDARWYQMGVSTSGSVLEIQAGLGITVDDTDDERPVVSINRAVTDQFYLDSAEGIILIDERIPVIVDSAYVNLRSDHYTRTQFESDALEFVDSNYINARADFYTTANHDSDTLVQVDSAYVQARVTFPVDNIDSAYVASKIDSALAVAVDSVGLDSAAVVSIIDSYVDSGGFVKLNEVNTQTSETKIAGLGSGREFVFEVDTNSGNGGGFRITHPTQSGLLYSWGNSIRTAHIASADNEILNRYAGDQRYAFKNRIVQVGDSDPTVVGTSLYDSFADSNNLWWQPTQRVLRVRVNGAWQTIGDSDTTLSNTDSLLEGDSNLYYTTARHDSDTLIQVDSAYVQARQLLGGSVTVDSVAPSPAQNGQLWYDNTSGVLHIRDSGLWDSINAQDSGAYLLLSGGTVTGPLNLDSGGIQFGPDSDRIKLYTGFSTFASPLDASDSADDTWDAAVPTNYFPEAIAYNESDNRIVVISDDNKVFLSDDRGLSWNRATNDAKMQDQSIATFDGNGGFAFQNVNYYPPMGNDSEGIYIAFGRDTIPFFSSDGDSWSPALVDSLSDDFDFKIKAASGISRGLDDSDNSIYFIGEAYMDHFFASSGRTNGRVWHLRSKNDSDGWPGASLGYRNDTQLKIGQPAYSAYHQKWIIALGDLSDNNPTLSVEKQRIWQSTNGRNWTPTGTSGYEISNRPLGGTSTEPAASTPNAVIEDPRTGYMAFYHDTGNSAMMVTTDGGSTWFTPKFRDTDGIGARSIVDTTVAGGGSGINLRKIVFDKNANVFYALAADSNGDDLREYFSSDLLNWVKGPQIAATNTTLARGAPIALDNGEFMRAGVNTSGKSTSFAVGSYGDVSEGVGSLKFGNDVVLTSENFNRYIPQVTLTPEATEFGSIVFNPTDGFNTGSGASDGYGEEGNQFVVLGPGKLDTCAMRRVTAGQYRVFFADWKVTDELYSVTATIEASGIFTASARTAMITNKAASGFDIILQRTDNSNMTTVEDDITTVSVNVFSKLV